MNLLNQNKGCTGNKCHIDEALDYLPRLSVFKDTPLEIMKLYAYLSKREQYAAGDRILRQGDPCDRILLIMSGEVSICEKHRGTSYQMQLLKAEEVNHFGELALIARFNWFFSAWAKTDVTLLSISREAFQKVMEKYPDQYPAAVEKIVKFRIDRIIAQTGELIDKADLNLWKECSQEQSDR